MKDHHIRLWKTQIGIELGGVGNDGEMVEFDAKDDKEKVTIDVPWVLFDHYFSVKV